MMTAMPAKGVIRISEVTYTPGDYCTYMTDISLSFSILFKLISGGQPRVSSSANIFECPTATFFSENLYQISLTFPAWSAPKLAYFYT